MAYLTIPGAAKLTGVAVGRSDGDYPGARRVAAEWGALGALLRY